MSHDHTFIYSEEVKKYKVRPFHNQRDSDAEKLAKVAAGQALSPADESLVEKCLTTVTHRQNPPVRRRVHPAGRASQQDVCTNAAAQGPSPQNHAPGFK